MSPTLKKKAITALKKQKEPRIELVKIKVDQILPYAKAKKLRRKIGRWMNKHGDEIWISFIIPPHAKTAGKRG